jgi:hypothetical protein
VKVTTLPQGAPLVAGGIDYEWIWTLVGLGVVTVAIGTSATIGWPRVPCVFRGLTGLPCLTCGATRALASLLAGDVAAAIRLNPLASSAVLAYPAFSVYAVGARWSAWPRVRLRLDRRDRRWARWIACALLGVTWLFLIADGR